MPQTASLSLTGVVVDSSAKPVAKVQVHLEEPRLGSSDMEQKRTEVRFDRLSLGTYRVTIRGEGTLKHRLKSARIQQGREFTAASETVKKSRCVARPEPINVDSVAPQNLVNDEVIQNLHGSAV